MISLLVSILKYNKMSPNTKPERPRPKPLTIENKIVPKKVLIKGKERKIFDSLNIPLPKKDNQKDTSTDKVN